MTASFFCATDGERGSAHRDLAVVATGDSRGKPVGVLVATPVTSLDTTPGIQAILPPDPPKRTLCRSTRLKPATKPGKTGSVWVSIGQLEPRRGGDPFEIPARTLRELESVDPGPERLSVA